MKPMEGKQVTEMGRCIGCGAESAFLQSLAPAPALEDLLAYGGGHTEPDPLSLCPWKLRWGEDPQCSEVCF